ncbi:dynein regulatory complex subunit 6 [Polypterus senegalus]|uniref:dynein regulatory complex subunit 6 n=1 Tax=Polypterus senegalus TaxID=55291 RepID=UPI001962BF28|nr:dynein regulatory complex subunit 6 [Polypterus senegalus]
MASLQYSDPDLRNYIRRKSLPEIYEALLTGICIMCPADPLKFLEEKIKEMQEKGHLNIIWDMFIDESRKMKVKRMTQSCLALLFGYEEDMMVSSHLYEKAYLFYRKCLTRMCYNSWIQYILNKQARTAYFMEEMNMAEQHYNRVRLKVTFQKWTQWLHAQRKIQTNASKKISGVYDRILCQNVFRAWQHVVQDSKKTKEYFERLERGQMEREFGPDFYSYSGDPKDDNFLLPKRAALKIFSYLGIADLVRCGGVCRYWKMISQTSSLWSRIDFSPEKHRIVDSAVVRILQKYRPYIIHLNLRSCSSLQWTSFKCVSECRNLQDLNLSQCASVNDETIKMIAEGCPTLLYLNLSYTDVTDGTIRMLSRCCLNLQYLSLSYSRKFTDKGLQYLVTGKGCHKLIYLDLSGCTQISVDGFRYIAEACSLLQQLEMNSVPTLTDSCIMALTSKCQQVKIISVQDSPHLSDTAFKAMGESWNLKKIRIEGNNRMTDVSWKTLSKNSPNLCSISAVNCSKITDISLKSIGSLKKISVLNLADCIRVSDPGVRYFVEGPSSGVIKELNLTNCVRLSDVSLLRIAQKCQKLTHLSLCYCEHLTDSGFEWLENLQSLTCLDLSGTCITDQGLAAVGGNTGIKKLVLSECLGITDIGIQKFCRQVRDLECLDVSHCLSLTDQTSKTLAYYCRTIATLSVAGCPKITDLSMQYLCGVCHYLKELDISGCVHLTDKTARFLYRISKQLKVLNMLYCKKISRQAVLKLAKNVPQWKHNSEDPPSWFGYNDQGILNDAINKQIKEPEDFEEMFSTTDGMENYDKKSIKSH